MKPIRTSQKERKFFNRNCGFNTILHMYTKSCKTSQGKFTHGTWQMPPLQKGNLTKPTLSWDACEFSGLFHPSQLSHYLIRLLENNEGFRKLSRFPQGGIAFQPGMPPRAGIFWISPNSIIDFGRKKLQHLFRFLRPSFRCGNAYFQGQFDSFGLRVDKV